MQPTEEQSLELYGYWRSSASWRVRISLCLKSKSAIQVSVHMYSNQLDIPFKNIPVNLVKGQQKDESYTEIINPNSLVPTLCIKNHNDTIYISQSPAILEYLEECPQYSILLPKLLPLDPVERAQVRALCMLIGCDIHPIQNLRVLNRVAPDASTPEGAEKRKEWAAHWINTGFIGTSLSLSLACTYCTYHLYIYHPSN